MTEIVLQHRRIAVTEKSTLSTLNMGSKVLFFLLEDALAKDQDGDGDVDKVRGSTCIEAGEGWLLPWAQGRFYSDYRTRFGHDFALALQMEKGVDRWGKVITHGNIRVHMGNNITHTDGCPITGTTPFMDKNGNFAFLSGTSGAAYNKILYPFLRKLWEPGMRDFKQPIKWKITEHF